MFKEVTFQNLRCFKDFTLTDMTPVTLISGRNNVGKTTVLEGIFLLLRYRSIADTFITINLFRGLEHHNFTPQGFVMELNPTHLWETLFAGLDMEQEMRISMKDHAGLTRTLHLAKDTQFSITTFKHNKPQPMLPAPGSYALKLEHKNGMGPESTETGWLILTQAGMTFNFDTPPHLPLPPFVIYGSPNTRPGQQVVAEWLGHIELKNKKELLTKKLHLLCEEIEDIFTVPRNGTINIFSRLQNGNSLPLRTMGDGINTLLHYLAVMIANPGGIFLFDEIETGFHYSFYPKLWELVAAVAKETGSQVIATTHSYECISAAVEGTSKIDPLLLTYFRLGEEDAGIVPYSYSSEDLAYALEQEMEIR